MQELEESIKKSALYSEDLAPVPHEKRNWNIWHLAALWVGMAVCIPTYMLASSMVIDGFSWIEALLIVALGNIIITVPMMLTGHAGVKYGVPFPVIGRAAFGTVGIHLPAILRGIVACGWFGIQTWLGGLAFYAIGCVILGVEASSTLNFGQFLGFGVFWLVNVYFIWKGTESIRWLEEWSAPILIALGLLLIGWGWYNAGGFGIVLKQSQQLEKPTALVQKTAEGNSLLLLNPLRDKAGKIKAEEYKLSNSNDWVKIEGNSLAPIPLNVNTDTLKISFRKGAFISRELALKVDKGSKSLGERLSAYLFWLTVMVGFWGTMAISIADITRYSQTQKDQVLGQLIGLPGTMVLYSFVGIFVTCAAVINFNDILVGEDAPWDPVQLLAKFENPIVVILAQIFMIIATLSTNIAANVIAPANAFSNLLPSKLSFKGGGLLTAFIGILICPWWLLGSIVPVLLFVSGLLGPILGILVADYFWVRKTNININELYKMDGIYGRVNPAAMIALFLGVGVVLLGYFIPALAIIYQMSWFSGFAVAFLAHGLLGRRKNIIL